jgi:hypothetical protein
MSPTAEAIDLRCRICSRDLQRPRTGRPPAYCSVACRRSGEFEIRRLQRRLSTLEDLASDARLGGALGRVSRANAKENERAYAGEIAHLEGRLRSLFEDER